MEIALKQKVNNEKAKTSKSLWGHAFETLVKDRFALISLIIIVVYFGVAVLSVSGLMASDWAREVGDSYLPPSWDFIMGTDIFGRSV